MMQAGYTEAVERSSYIGRYRWGGQRALRYKLRQSVYKVSRSHNAVKSLEQSSQTMIKKGTYRPLCARVSSPLAAELSRRCLPLAVVMLGRESILRLKHERLLGLENHAISIANMAEENHGHT